MQLVTKSSSVSTKPLWFSAFLLRTCRVVGHVAGSSSPFSIDSELGLTNMILLSATRHFRRVDIEYLDHHPQTVLSQKNQSLSQKGLCQNGNWVLHHRFFEHNGFFTTGFFEYNKGFFTSGIFEHTDSSPNGTSNITGGSAPAVFSNTRILHHRVLRI